MVSAMSPPTSATECFDAVVIGGGPAGLAAATWLGRYRRTTLVLDHGQHRNASVEWSHGYLGLDPVPPPELLDAARAGIDGYPAVQRRSAEATAVRGEVGRFAVDLADGSCVEARRVILATGVRDVFPDIEGFEEHYGASVFHCPSCDGLEAEGREVVAIGWSPDIAGFALQLLDWDAAVTVVTDGRRFEGDDARRRALDRHGVRIVEDRASTFLGTRGDLRGVRLAEGSEVACSLAFFAVDHRPRSPLAEAVGCRRTDQGCLVVDDGNLTSVPGIYAAGDITPGYQLIQVAAAKGTIAGVSAALSLGLDIDEEVGDR